MIIVPDSSGPSAPGDCITARVEKVFDGDGFLASAWNPYRGAWVAPIPFRLAFIDAPELDQPAGLESRNFLSELIAGRSLELVPVLKGSSSATFIDPYQRVLCVPYLTVPLDAGKVDYFWNRCCCTGEVRRPRSVTRNIELEMVVNGWAWVVERYAFDNEPEYFAAQDDARRNRRGLWSVKDPEPPWSFKRRQRHRHLQKAGQGRLL